MRSKYCYSLITQKLKCLKKHDIWKECTLDAQNKENVFRRIFGFLLSYSNIYIALEWISCTQIRSIVFLLRYVANFVAIYFRLKISSFFCHLTNLLWLIHSCDYLGERLNFYGKVSRLSRNSAFHGSAFGQHHTVFLKNTLPRCNFRKRKWTIVAM